ncbi:MAG: hypothetical protein IKD66_15580 [Solobacterium sp.]|nr:hypothetical protein [Solobacterium sp.]
MSLYGYCGKGDIFLYQTCPEEREHRCDLIRRLYADHDAAPEDLSGMDHRILLPAKRITPEFSPGEKAECMFENESIRI